MLPCCNAELVEFFRFGLLDASHRYREPEGILWGNQVSCDTVQDNLGIAAHIGRNYGQSHRGSFEKSHRQTFEFGGQNESIRGLIKV
jgi:hypothetical protein